MNERYRLSTASGQVGRTSESASHPYKYKDSGVPWLGQVPVHWKVFPHRALFMEVNERNHPDETMLSVTIARGVIPQEVLLADSSKKDSSNLDKSNYKLVQPGDIAYNKMRAWQGAIGVSQHRGIVSPAYVVIRPRQQQVPEYYHYLLRTPGFITEAERWSYGITSDMWSLRAEDFKRIYNVLPPLEEQRAIAAFLAHHDRLTRRYIHAQQRLIALLTEQKQALIQQAVTRGLDPDVPLKDSGIEWLGKIPAHWEVRRNSRIFLERNSPGRADLPIMIVSLNSGVTIGEEIDDNGRPRRLIEDRSSYKFAAKGDIAYNMMRMWQGAVGVVPANGLVSPAYVVARPLSGINSQYFAYLFRTSEYKNEVNRNSRGIVSDRNRLYWDGFKNLVSLVPPIEEQDSIVEYIISESTKIDNAITRTQRQIDLLREYRTRLIADVVTGKLDVRGFEVGRTFRSASHLEDDNVWDDVENEEIEDALDDLDGEAVDE